MGLAALWRVGSSRTRDRTCVSCIGRQILHHWATREAFWLEFLKQYSLSWGSFTNSFMSVLKEIGKRLLLQGVPVGTVPCPRPPSQLGPSWEAVDVRDFVLKPAKVSTAWSLNLASFLNLLEGQRKRDLSASGKVYCDREKKQGRWTLWWEARRSQFPRGTYRQQGTSGCLGQPLPLT